MIKIVGKCWLLRNDGRSSCLDDSSLDYLILVHLDIDYLVSPVLDLLKFEYDVTPGE